MASVSLKDEAFWNAALTEDMMTASLPLGKSQVPKQAAEAVEADIRIRTSIKNLP